MIELGIDEIKEMSAFKVSPDVLWLDEKVWRPLC